VYQLRDDRQRSRRGGHVTEARGGEEHGQGSHALPPPPEEVCRRERPWADPLIRGPRELELDPRHVAPDDRVRVGDPLRRPLAYAVDRRRRPERFHACGGAVHLGLECFMNF
jgi:hypothetical protein